MQLETVKINPFILKPLHNLFYPWRKYNEFFDKGCWGIWGLPALLKYTLLYFAAFFISPMFGWVKLGEDSSSLNIYFDIFIIGLLIVAFIWFLYLPVLSLILLFRLLKQIQLIINQTVKLWKEQPWKMTPIKLYTQPHWGIVVFLLYLKDYLFDIVDWTGQFYPISLVYTSPIKYPFNIKIRHNARAFEIQIALMNIPLKYVNSEINQQFVLYKFEPYERLKNPKRVVKKLTKSFQERSIFYVREENGQIIILSPHRQ